MLAGGNGPVRRYFDKTGVLQMGRTPVTLIAALETVELLFRTNKVPCVRENHLKLPDVFNVPAAFPCCAGKPGMMNAICPIGIVAAGAILQICFV
jgi:hypothetical protein